MNPYDTYIPDFDFKNGLWNSLEQVKMGRGSKLNFFIETTRNLLDTDEWITAVYMGGKYYILDKIRDIAGRRAKQMHWDFLHDIKYNGYSVDHLINGGKYHEYDKTFKEVESAEKFNIEVNQCY